MSNPYRYKIKEISGFGIVAEGRRLPNLCDERFKIDRATGQMSNEMCLSTRDISSDVNFTCSLRPANKF